MSSAEVDAVRDLVIGDDFGLYEVVWHFNVVFPGAEVADRVRAAREAVRTLVASGELQLIERDPGSHSERQLRPTSAARILEDSVNWEPPKGNVDYLLRRP